MYLESGQRDTLAFRVSTDRLVEEGCQRGRQLQTQLVALEAVLTKHGRHHDSWRQMLSLVDQLYNRLKVIKSLKQEAFFS